MTRSKETKFMGTIIAFWVTIIGIIGSYLGIYPICPKTAIALIIGLIASFLIFICFWTKDRIIDRDYNKFIRIENEDSGIYELHTKFNIKLKAQFIDLYHRKFPEDDKQDIEDIENWLKDDHSKEKDNPYIDRILLAVKKVAGNLHGFLYFTYYLKQKQCFISWIANEDDKVDALIFLVNRFKNRFSNELKECKELLFDIDRHDGKLQYKIDLFKVLAKDKKYKMNILDNVPYRQPDLKPERSDSQYEKDNLLVLIRTSEEDKDSDFNPSDDEIKSILDFVYLHVYYDSYKANNKKANKKYKNYLEKRCPEIFNSYLENKRPDA